MECLQHLLLFQDPGDDAGERERYAANQAERPREFADVRRVAGDPVQVHAEQTGYERGDGNDERDVFGRANLSLKPVNKQVIVPSDEEVERNPRAKSAKLRISERI